MRSKAITAETKSVLDKIAASRLAEKFYLAGGTALALQLGHRESIDLDWFSETDFSIADLKRNLSNAGVFEVVGEEPGTLHGLLDDVKITFLRYEYPLLYPFVKFENVFLADERDIAAMKIDAVSSRGSKKDFIDLYFLMQKYSLNELIGFFEKKYAGIHYNKMHILKSSVYFEDAENDPMPLMLKSVEWEEIKKSIRINVNKSVDTD